MKLALYLVIPIMILLGGCNSEQIDDLKQQVARTQAVLDQAVAAKAEVDAAVQAMPPGDDRAKAVAFSAKLQGVIDQASAVLPRLQSELADAQDTLGVLQAGVTAAAPLIPPPWGTVAAAAAGLLIGLIRAAANRSAGRRIAASIEQNATPEGTVNLSDPATRDRLRTAQGALAGRLVDEAQGKSLALPF